MMRKLLMSLVAVIIFQMVAATNRALIIGIGDYPEKETGWKKIHGDNDVKLLKPAFAKAGFTDIKTLVNSEATKLAIVREIKALAQRCKPGDKVYIHFSGHGQPVKDYNGDEEDFIDESFIPYDAYNNYVKGKYWGQNHLIDDEYYPMLNDIKKKIGTDGLVFVSFDACFSRGMERGQEEETDNEFTRGSNDVFIVYDNNDYLKKMPKPGTFSKGATLIIVSACHEMERNYEFKATNGKVFGSLSYYIYKLLEKDADFNRWAECFNKKRYVPYNIFKSNQHPQIVIYK